MGGDKAWQTYPRRKTDAARRESDHPYPDGTGHGAAGRCYLCGAVLKLFDLQIRQHDELQEKAVAQQTRSTVITCLPGHHL